MARKLLNIPTVIQSNDSDCGSCALQSILRFYEIKETHKKIKELLCLEPKHGADIPNIVAVAELYGLKVVSRTGLFIHNLIEAVDNGYPAMVEIQIKKRKDMDWRDSNNYGHYCVVKGYDSNRNKIFLKDPLQSDSRILSFEDMIERWHGYATNDIIYQRWAMIAKGRKNKNQ